MKKVFTVFLSISLLCGIIQPTAAYAADDATDQNTPVFEEMQDAVPDGENVSGDALTNQDQSAFLNQNSVLAELMEARKDQNALASETESGEVDPEAAQAGEKTYHHNAITIDDTNVFYYKSFEFGTPIDLVFKLWSFGDYNYEKYYVRIYDSNGYLIAGKDGDFPSTLKQTTLTLTWSTCESPGVYYARMYATHASDTDDIYIPFYVVPTAVTNLQAASSGKNKVTLSWNASTGSEGYLVYGQKSGKYAYVGMTTTGTSFTDNQALDTDYNFYWVFPYIKSEKDKMLPGKCPKYVFAKGVCAAVANLRAASVKGGVKLTWTASKDAEGYLVYGIVNGQPYGYIGMASGTAFIDKKASATEYNYYYIFPYHKDANGKMIPGLTGKYTYGKALQ